MATYAELKEEIKRVRAEMTQKAKDFLTDSSRQVFEKFPDLKSFSWKQYTPYFNDGDECVFSAQTDYPDIVYGEAERDEDDETYFGKEDQSPEAQAWREVSELLKIFDEGDLRELFGDHVRVTVTREGASVDEYEHD